MRGVITDGTGKRAALEYYHVAGKTGTSKKFSQTKGLYTDSQVSSFAGIVPLEDPSLCVLVIIDAPSSGQGGGSAAAPVFAGIAGSALPYLRVSANTVKAAGPLAAREQGIHFNGKSMPDFKKLSLGESLTVLNEMEDYGIVYSLQGTGRVYRQSPAAGDKLAGERVVLYFK
jgi:membrane peptidoglycan carboxypeptidase